MRMNERLQGMKNWIYKELCEGREMKTIPASRKVTEIVTAEPKVYLGWAPRWLDKTGNLRAEPENVAPGIIIMPTMAHAAYTEEKRYDRYESINRNKQMGQQFSVSMLFSVYEPGVRYPGFAESAHESGRGLDLSLIGDGTEQGLFTLMDWMNDAMILMLNQKMVPNTDLSLDEESLTYSLFTDQAYIVDRRPIYYGFVAAKYICYVETGDPVQIEQYLQ